MWKMVLSLLIMNTSFFPLINIMYLQEKMNQIDTREQVVFKVVSVRETQCTATS